MITRGNLSLIFLISTIVAMLSLLCLFFYIMHYFINDFSQFEYISLLILMCLSFLGMFVTLRKLLLDIKCEIREIEKIEKTVRDIYRYDQFLDPPEADN